MTPLETEAEIVRLYRVERVRIGTIARLLRVHRDVVARVVAQETAADPPVTVVATPPTPTPPLLMDEYRGFVEDQWNRYPKLLASSLYRMCKARGYGGGPDHFRHQVAPMRPRPVAEAYLRIHTLPAEQAQVDWAHFGHVQVGRARRALMAFLLVLSWSRRLFVHFFLGARLENFLRGHEKAFERWGGVSRIVLHDNLRSAVLERRGQLVRFHPTFQRFATHYAFEPRAAAVARGNEKGRVERGVRYLREAFFEGRPVRDLDTLNQEVAAWTEGEASDRPWPEDRSRTVRDAFEEERARLLPLPADRFPTEEVVEVAVPKTPYVRFDLNDYSVPHTLVHRTLEVRATLEQVRVFADCVLVATHRRSFDRGQTVEDRSHVTALEAVKRGARQGRGQDRLVRAVPQAEQLLLQHGRSGENVGSAVHQLLRLLDNEGAIALQEAVQEALALGRVHPRAVRHLLEKKRQERGEPPRIPLALPDDARVREVTIRPHDLRSYDALHRRRPSSNDGEDATRPDRTEPTEPTAPNERDEGADR